MRSPLPTDGHGQDRVDDPRVPLPVTGAGDRRSQRVDSTQTTTLTYRDVLRIAVMRQLWYAQIASLLGDWLALYAIISVISFRLNGSAGQIAAVQIAAML